MENKQQSEALRLANYLHQHYDLMPTCEPLLAASELRRLHAESEQHQQELAAYRFTVENREARIAELEAELEVVGAGGVQRLSAAPRAVQAAVPDGWKLVPMEPQDMQQVAGAQAIRFDTTVINKMWTANKVYREMVAAATAHPAEAVPAQVVELEVDDLIDRLLDAQQDLNLAANVHMDQSIASASTLLDEVEIALRTLAATQPTPQGMDAQRLDYLQETESTVDLLIGQPMRFRVGGLHNAVSTDLRTAIDAALAAQAKQGEQANG